MPVNETGSDSDSVSCSFEANQFTVYKKRWLILIVLSVLQASNAMIWLSYAPVADITADFYATSLDNVNYLSLVFMVATVLFGALSAYVLDHLGLRAGIIIGAWLNLAGAVVKLVSALEIFSTSTAQWKLIAAFIGQSLAALSQPYNMFATTKLAALWFPEDKRALANTIASMANPLGLLIASLTAPAIVQSSADMKTLLAFHCGPAGLAAFASLVIVTSSTPPTPPSASAHEESIPFFTGVKMILKNAQYLVLMVSCGSGIALFTVLTTLLQQMLCPYGYSDSFAGLCGALMIGCGIIGAGLSSIICDKTKRFEEVLKTCFTFGVAFASLFQIVCRYSDQQVLVALSTAAFGFFGFALYPVALELGVEVTFPVAEATSSAFIIMSGQVLGILLLIVMQTLETNLSTSRSTCASSVPPQDFTYANLLFVSMGAAVCLLLVIGFKATYKRMRAEQEAAAERIISFSSNNPRIGHL